MASPSSPDRRKPATGAPEASTQVLSGDPSALSAALDRRDLSEKDVVLLLRNPALPASAVERICQQGVFLNAYRVQAAVAQNPKTPQPYALRLLTGLFWRDQLQVARNFKINMVVRRRAEGYLVERLRKLSLGEKMELARLATSEVLKGLVLDRDHRVLNACLENSQATEAIVTRMIRSEHVNPTFLLTISQTPKWISSYAVKHALVRAVRTPIPLVLRLLPLLRAEDLRDLVEDTGQPEIVSRQAIELIALKDEDAIG